MGQGEVILHKVRKEHDGHEEKKLTFSPKFVQQSLGLAFDLQTVCAQRDTDTGQALAGNANRDAHSLDSHIAAITESLHAGWFAGATWSFFRTRLNQPGFWRKRFPPAVMLFPHAEIGELLCVFRRRGRLAP